MLKQLADMGYTSVEAASYKDGKTLRTDPRTVPQGRGGGRHESALHALHDQSFGRGAGRRRLLEGPRMVGRVHRGAQGRRCGIHRRPVDAEGLDARRAGDLLPLFQRNRRPLQGRRAEIRLPQPLARIREDRGPSDARLHDREHRSRQGAVRNGCLLGRDGKGQPGGLFQEVPGAVQAAAHQGPP